MLIAIGIAVAFNFIIILVKMSRQRFADAALDALFLGGVSYLFSGSFNALTVGTIASAIVSIYLLAFPPKLDKLLD
jgi:hypothetical protein